MDALFFLGTERDVLQAFASSNASKSELGGMNTYHLAPHESGWRLTLAGFDDPIETFLGVSQIEALGQSVEIIRGLQEPATLRVYREDGTFDERSFPNQSGA